ncbi:MAG: hypothetical protein EB084_14380 [Proteobacteria bacterium]|nr:hypothetical protein [Pseudomonadota bacterium]
MLSAIRHMTHVHVATPASCSESGSTAASHANLGRRLFGLHGNHRRTDDGTILDDPRSQKPEDANLFGRVHVRYPDGRSKVLAHRGETRPDATSPDDASIPEEAVVNNRVVLFVDGIQETLPGQTRCMGRLFQSPAELDYRGVDVGQAVVGVHEGVGKSRAADLKRIVGDIFLLKGLQTPFLRAEHAAALVATRDPAVKALHDEVRQSLELGRDVLIACHSGGGAETALALTILAKEDHGRFRKDIREHVRVLSLSGAVSPRDYEIAGVKHANIHYTASVNDPLYLFAKNYLHPLNPIADIPVLVNGIHALYRVATGQGLPCHSADYIFAHSRHDDGFEPIQAFVDGAKGGVFPLDKKASGPPA